MAELRIRFSGAGGQGLILSARLLAAALAAEGRSAAQSQSYEPVSRGGLSRADLVVGEAGGEAAWPLPTRLDWLLILDAAAAGASDGLLSQESVVLADEEAGAPAAETGASVRRLPFLETARRLGARRVANIVALAALTRLSGACARDSLEAAVRAGAPPRLLRLNMEALEAGWKLAEA